MVRYAVRRGSGGRGARRGGDGLVRAIEARARVQATVVAERHERGPYGGAGGDAGRPGAARVIRASGRSERLAAKAGVTLEPGDVLELSTPGGGGHGRSGT